MKLKLTLILLMTTLLAGGTVFADGNQTMSDTTRKLNYNLKIDAAITGTAALGYIILAATQNRILPAKCRWCNAGSFDTWGHNNIKWENTGTANTAVYVTGYALAPIAAFGMDALAANHKGNISDFYADALIIAEATAISSFATELVKISAARERPNAHFGNRPQNSKNNDSFYSGHTSLAFSLAAASGTVASMRGYEMAPYIWGTGMAIAALTGYLSIASDRHYLTDVITGAGLGSAIGFAVPYLFHRSGKRSQNIAFLPVPAEKGGILTISGLF